MKKICVFSFQKQVHIDANFYSTATATG